MASFEKIDNNHNIIVQIKKNFNVQEVVAGKLVFGSDIPVILVQFHHVKDVERYWKEFNSLVTAEYLTELTEEFSKWNSYIFFITKALSKALKYEIENNKFSTRKIVIELENPQVDDDLISNIISEHIVNDNIKFDVKRKDIGDFPKNKMIGSVLEDVIKNGSKKLDDETLTKLLTTIETGLADEN